MPYALHINKRVERELNALPSVVYGRVRRAINSLRDTPRPDGVKKMRGSASTYRVRVGDYRIVYEVDDAAQDIRLLHVGDRKDVYR